MCADECARVRVRVWEQFILVLRSGVVVLWCCGFVVGGLGCFLVGSLRLVCTCLVCWCVLLLDVN